MKRIISLMLVLLLCVGFAACGNSGSSSDAQKQEHAAELPRNVQMYTPGMMLETDFGSITIMDAAFCTKAQLYFTKSTSTRKSTINGKTTESYSETIHPGYLNTMDNKLVFALKTVMTNTTSEDLDIHKLSVRAFFTEDTPVYFSKGGNYNIADEAYKTLAAGQTSEIILAALLPVEQYRVASECLLDVEGSELGFRYENINVYNALGFQEGDNTSCTIDEVIHNAANSPAPQAAPAEEETEPMEIALEIDTMPGTYKKDGSSGAEGRAIQIQDVEVGFSDVMPNVITSGSQYSHSAEQYALNDSQTYAVIRFKLTNLTAEEMKVVDHKGDFMIQMTYDGRYKYSTRSETWAFLTVGAQYGGVRKGSTFNSAGGMSISPLASADVTAYIPCAKQVAENMDKDLSVTFIAKHAGNESFEFIIR